MANQTVQWDALQPKSWYVLRHGELSGPMSETEIRKLVLEETLEEDTKIKQGDSEFLPASKIRDLFVTLGAQGWYVLEGDVTHGPYVGDKLLALVASGFFSSEKILVRQGDSGSWIKLDEAKKVFRRQARRRRKASKKARAAAVKLDVDSILNEDPETDSNPQQPVALAGQAPIPPAMPQSDEPDVQWTGRKEASAAEQQETKPRTTGVTKQTHRPAKTTCPECGRERIGKSGICKHCAAKKKKSEAKLARQKARLRVNTDNPSENLIGKLFLLAAAFGTSGFFLSKWLVTAGLWKDFHTRDQQMWGWVCLAIGLMLASVGALAIYLDPFRRADRKLIATGALSLLLVGLVYYTASSSRLRAAQEDMDKQNQMWAEFMIQGGYQDGED